METVKNVNVYNKISRGEHICKGNKLYSRDEMKKMLVDSGLSLDEIKVIYSLNAETAGTELQEIMNKNFFTISSEENTRLHGDSWTQKRFYTLEIGNALFKALAFFQILMFALYAASLYSKGVFSSTRVVTFILVISFSYLLAALSIAFISDHFVKVAIRDANSSEDFGYNKVKITIKNRWKMMNIVWNTLTMYDCMEEVIESGEEVKKSNLLFPEEKDADDLK